MCVYKDVRALLNGLPDDARFRSETARDPTPTWVGRVPLMGRALC